jgi:diguanylate cyclase (GGDEF)-like protein/PAS domain S-box-containing protein
MDHLSSAVFVGLLTVDGTLTFANRAALEAIGSTLADVVGNPFEGTPWWRASEIERIRLRQGIDAAARGSASHFEHTFRDIHGKQRVMDFTLHPVHRGKRDIAYITASAHDITERKRAQQALQFAQFALDHAAIAVLKIRADGKVHCVNSAAAKLLGYSEQELCQMDVPGLSQRVTTTNWPALWKRLKSRKSLHFESVYTRKDGRAIPVDISVSYNRTESDEYAVAFLLDLSERRQAEEYIHYLAHHDVLTGLANRTLFGKIIAQHVRHVSSASGKLAIVIVDIERFGKINETLGRPAGNQLLTQVAGRMVRYAHGRHGLARVGADQFALAISGVKNEQDAVRYVSQCRHDCFDAPFLVEEIELILSAKFGIAMSPDDGEDAELLIKRAEAALQQAKHSGERYVFYTHQFTALDISTLKIESKLRQALEKSEFALYYQPKIHAANGHISGVEALIRWNSPEWGVVLPSQFMALVEETGLILEVGAWALQQAAMDRQKWSSQGRMAPRIAVNVSAVQLRSRDFVLSVQQALEHDPTPHGIDLEITETALMDDIQSSISKLTAVRDMGVDISIDDFGTGYSSLTYLIRLPIQTLKIDRSFIAALIDEPNTMTLVSAVISLAHSLRLDVVAEGVENEDQLNALNSLGCDHVQGYFFYPPLPFEKMAALLAQ